MPGDSSDDDGWIVLSIVNVVEGESTGAAAASGLAGCSGGSLGGVGLPTQPARRLELSKII